MLKSRRSPKKSWSSQPATPWTSVLISSNSRPPPKRMACVFDGWTRTVSGTTGDGGSESTGTISHRGEHVEIEQRLRGRLDRGGGVLLARMEVHGSPQGRLLDGRVLRLPLGLGVAHDCDGAEHRPRPGAHAEGVVDGVRGEVRLRVGLDRGVGVPVVGEHARDVGPGLRVALLVEAGALRERGGRGGARGVRDLGGSPSRPSTRRPRSSIGGPSSTTICTRTCEGVTCTTRAARAWASKNPWPR